MAWKVEVTFYREIEGTENLASYLPNRWIQSCEYRVSLVPVLGAVQTVLIKGEDYFLNRVPPEENNCEGWNCHGPKEGTLLKGFGGASGFRPLPASAAFCCSGGWGGGGEGLQRPSQPSGPAVRTFLESTQAHFDSWQPHCVSVSPLNNIITIMVAQMAMFFGNLSAGKEITKRW